jgi:hypothetical protein
LLEGLTCRTINFESKASKDDQGRKDDS